MSKLVRITVAALAVATVVAASASLSAQPATASVPALSAGDQEALVFMREEEKLARDIYLKLASRSSVPVFRNIARSEQRHMNAIKTLLDRYGIADPTTGKAVGEFSDPGLQTLYQTMLAKGSRSVADAYAVGVEIEKVDIADLRAAISASSNTDLKLVFGRLLAGSQQHLRAFSAHL